MLNNVQKEIIDLFVSHSLYFKKQGLNPQVFEHYANSVSYITDIVKFVKVLREKIGDTHSFAVSKDKTQEARVVKNEQNFDFESEISKGIAYITIPPVFGDEETYQKYSQNLFSNIERLSKEKPEAWCIDLRKNWGGNMWVMLASLYSFFNENSVIGLFKYADERTYEWKYKDGYIYSGTKKMFELPSRVNNLTEIPVEILIGEKTGSSGEAVVIAFKSRQNVSFVGEKTSGLTTGNEDFELSDGSILYLCTCDMADSRGETYPNGIKPDQI